MTQNSSNSMDIIDFSWVDDPPETGLLRQADLLARDNSGAVWPMTVAIAPEYTDASGDRWYSGHEGKSHGVEHGDAVSVCLYPDELRARARDLYVANILTTGHQRVVKIRTLGTVSTLSSLEESDNES